MTSGHCGIDAGLDTCFANPGTSEMQLINEIGRTKGVRAVLPTNPTMCWRDLDVQILFGEGRKRLTLQAFFVN